MTKLKEAKNAIVYHDEVVKLLKTTAFNIFKEALNLSWNSYDMDRTILNTKKIIATSKSSVRFERVLDEFIKSKYGDQYSVSIRPDKNSAAFYDFPKKQLVLNSDRYNVTTASIISPLETFRNFRKYNLQSPDDFKFEYCVFNDKNITSFVSVIIHELQHVEQDYPNQPTGNKKIAHFTDSRSNDSWQSGRINASATEKYAVHFTKNVELQAIANEMVSVSVATLFPDGNYTKIDNKINNIDYNQFRDNVISNMTRFVNIFGKDGKLHSVTDSDEVIASGMKKVYAYLQKAIDDWWSTKKIEKDNTNLPPMIKLAMSQIESNLLDSRESNNLVSVMKGNIKRNDKNSDRINRMVASVIKKEQEHKNVNETITAYNKIISSGFPKITESDIDLNRVGAINNPESSMAVLCYLVASYLDKKTGITCNVIPGNETKFDIPTTTINVQKYIPAYQNLHVDNSKIGRYTFANSPKKQMETIQNDPSTFVQFAFGLLASGGILTSSELGNIPENMADLLRNNCKAIFNRAKKKEGDFVDNVIIETITYIGRILSLKGGKQIEVSDIAEPDEYTRVLPTSRIGKLRRSLILLDIKIKGKTLDLAPPSYRELKSKLESNKYVLVDIMQEMINDISATFGEPKELVPEEHNRVILNQSQRKNLNKVLKSMSMSSLTKLDDDELHDALKAINKAYKDIILSSSLLDKRYKTVISKFIE